MSSAIHDVIILLILSLPIIVSQNISCSTDNLSLLNTGCRKNCSCSNGTVTCIDACQTDTGSVFCRPVNILGTCCPATECEDATVDGDIVCQPPSISIDSEFRIAPWSYIIRSSSSSSSEQTLCGATLIREKWLITAARCVASRSAIELFEVHQIGQLSLTEDEPVQAVSRVVVLPGFSDNQHEFALLELESNIEITVDQQYVNLPRINRCHLYLRSPTCAISVMKTFVNETEFYFDQTTFARPEPCTLSVAKSGFCYRQLHDLRSSKSEKKQLVDGSGVFAKTNGHYDIVGIVISQPGNTSDYVKVVSICPVIEWITALVFQ